jgi:cell division transport system ATP-binding protein
MIRFDNITKKYPGTNRPALDAISVEVLRGEFVFLVGASGSGKSTCLRLVLKEDRPTSGSIHVLGQDLRSISNRKVPYFRRNLGVVFQDFRLLPNKSVFDNVAFSLQVIGKSRGFIQEAVPDTLKMVGLAEKAQRLPHELSGGEQQRVAIARAIVNKPQVLLADEPTGNLDPATSAGIMALLERINAGGTTVIMATHEAGIVDQMRRRVIELAGGKIVRDERQGGYATSAIPTVTAGAGTLRHTDAPAHTPALPAVSTGLPSVFAPARAQPLTHRSTPEPVAVPAARQTPASSRRWPEQTSATAADTGMPILQPDPEPDEIPPAEPGPSMSRPVLPVTQHDVPEQLTLAEKLGLRAPGEKPDQTGEQNVGPTR